MKKVRNNHPGQLYCKAEEVRELEDELSKLRTEFQGGIEL